MIKLNFDKKLKDLYYEIIFNTISIINYLIRFIEIDSIKIMKNILNILSFIHKYE